MVNKWRQFTSSATTTGVTTKVTLLLFVDNKIKMARNTEKILRKVKRKMFEKGR